MTASRLPGLRPQFVRRPCGRFRTERHALLRRPGIELAPRPSQHARLALLLLVPLGERWKERVDDIGRLVLVIVRVGLAADVPEEGADRGGPRWRNEFRSTQPRQNAARRDVPGGGAFDVAFDSGDLPGAVHVRQRFQGAVRRDHAGSVQEGIAVDLAKADPLRLREPWNAAGEDSLLLRPGEPRLETHEVPGRTRLVLTPQLHHRMRAPSGARAREPDRLHRTVGE